MAYHEYFPEELIALKKEIQNHPDLLIQLYGVATFDEMLGTVAAYCEIVLDGAYTAEDILKIMDICVRKLKEKGSLIVVH